MKRIITLLWAALIVPALNAQTESLTFRVDMSQQTVSPNGVHVAGSWQDEAGVFADWQPGESTMLDGDGDGIYELTVAVPVGNYEFKYINGNDWSEQPEGVPGECAQNGNRSVSVVAGGVSLDAVCFGACSECPSMVNNVNLTLQVDMSQQPSVDAAGVSVGGTFNGFSPEPMTDQGNGIWSLDISVAEGSTVLWKYINGQDFGLNTSIESVPSECGQDDGFGGNNRILVAPMADTVLDAVCYGECETCGVQGDFFNLTLVVDASDIASLDTSGIHAAGTFNSFTPTVMTDQGDGTWSITVSVEEGTEVLWKYINGSTFSDEVETVPVECSDNGPFLNRALVMPSADTTAGPVCFSSCTTCPEAPACELPYPQVDGLTFSTEPNGILLSWNPIEGSIGCQLQFQLPGGGTATRTKVGANVSDFFVPGNLIDPFQTYSYRVRCGCSQSPLIVGAYSEFSSFIFIPTASLEAEETTTIKSSPNPNSGISYISLNTSVSSDQASIEVFDMSGRLVDHIFQGNVEANHEMRFEFNRTDLPEGIYLIRYVSNGDVTTEKMMITK